MSRRVAALLALLAAVALGSLWLRARGGDPRLASGLAALEQKRWQDAVAELEPLVAARPDDGEARRALAFARLGTGDAREAARLWQLDLASEPVPSARAESLRGLATALERLGQSAEARDRLEQLATLESERRAADLLELGRLRYGAGELEPALAAVRLATELEPASADAWFRAGTLLVEAGRHDEARAPLERTLAIDPRHLGALVDLSKVAAHEGRQGEARRRLGQALALRPGSGTLLANIGWTFFAEGALDKALVYFERARAAEPADCNHVYAIAWTWLTRGDEARGRQALAEVERLCPGAPQVREYLAGATPPGLARSVEIEVRDRRPSPTPLWLALATGARPGPFPRTIALAPLAGPAADARRFGAKVEVAAADGDIVLLVDDDRDAGNGALAFARPAPSSTRVTLELTGRGPVPAPLEWPRRREGDGPPRGGSDGVRRVLVSWWDGASWSVAAPLIEVGRLPALAALMRAGTSALLDSTDPSTAKALRNLVMLERRESYTLRDLALDALSELRSTPDFDAVIDRRLDALLARSEKSIWDAFRERGVPALQLVFSNYAVQDPFDGMMITAAGTTERVEAPRRSLSGEAEASFSGPPSAEERERLGRMVAAGEVDGEHGRFALEALRLVRDKAGSARRAWREGKIRFAMVRFDETDVISHRYWTAMLAARSGTPSPRGGLVEGFYEEVDGELAAMLALLDGDDVAIVLSDHGMADGFRHSREAVLVLAGADIERARVLPGAVPITALPRLFLELTDPAISPRAALERARAAEAL